MQAHATTSTAATKTTTKEPKGSKPEAKVTKAKVAKATRSPKQSANSRPERTTYSVMTDAGGKFGFLGIAAGKYTLAFRIDAYTYQVYGQKSDSLSAPPIDIHEGRNDLGHVLIRPEAQVDGRIIDPSGGPIAGMTVYLVQAQPLINVDGDRRFRVVSETVTDTTGKYVLKKIVAGHYYIATGSSGRSEGIRVRPTSDGGRTMERIAAIRQFAPSAQRGLKRG